MSTNYEIAREFKIELAKALGLDPGNVYELHLNIEEDGRMYITTKQFIADFNKLKEVISKYALNIGEK